MRIGLTGLVGSLVLALSACNPAQEAAAPKPAPKLALPAQPHQAMVAAANPHAVEAGLEILRAGGTALDAAVAVQAMLGLVEPQSSGLGGGSFMLYYDAKSGKLSAWDGREQAPAGMRADTFMDANGKPWDYFTAVNSGHAVGSPGAIAMLGKAHEQFGRLDWAKDLQPARKLAENGFSVSPRLHGLLEAYGKRSGLDKNAAAKAYFFLPDGEPLPVGYNLKNPAYVHSLDLIAKDPRALLEGPLAREIVQAVHEGPHPGTMTLEDLKNYQPREREPVCRPYKQYSICGAPPPSSGGMAINSIMGILSNEPVSPGGASSVENWHNFIEAQRLAYADRDKYVADDRFVDVPMQGLLDPKYLKARAGLISEDKAIAHVTAGDPGGPPYGRDTTMEPGGTSHFVIVDQWGNALSMTTTVESVFGNKRFVGGFLLNNQLTDFARNAVDENGLPLANAPAPGKRPRSSMAPTIVMKDGKPFLLAGSPGGNSIIAYVAKTIVGVLDWGLTPQQAIDLPNVIARGDVTRVGPLNLDPKLVPALRAMGHDIQTPQGENSGLHLIEIKEDGSVMGGADPRREGQARKP